tara:strand:+ start:397 stop:858 length:462 start_codon:yes stop_codon:yes gene_type:complete
MSGIIGGAGSKSGVIGQTEIDYETGTWTIALACGSGTLTGSLNTGYYTKIGNLVHVQGAIEVNSESSASGSLDVTGLPFVVSALTEYADYCSFATFFDGIGNGVENMQAQGNPNASTIKIRRYSVSTFGLNNDFATYLDSDCVVGITGTYNSV